MKYLDLRQSPLTPLNVRRFKSRADLNVSSGVQPF